MTIAKLFGTQAELEFYRFSISIFISISILPIIRRFRIKKMYSFTDYSNRLKDFTSDEMFVYNLLSKKDFNFADLHKHNYICNQVFLEEKCPCPSYIENENEMKLTTIGEIKEKTCLVLSKIYKEFYRTPMNQITKNRLSFKDLYNIVDYEYTYRIFLKRIKTSISISKAFWEIIRKKPINNEKFLDNGIELADYTILISQDFGKMQKIHSNQIKLLKAFSCFLNSVLNDEEYSNILVNLVRENLQMLSKLNQVPNSNLLEREFGVVIISGLDHNLFKIVSYNKYAKMIFKLHPNFDLLNQDIHYLQPFPFNLLHLQYLKYKFDITLLSNERPLYALQENGDIAYVNANLIPCINFEGKINFFTLFYINKDETLVTSALTDINGKVFASTREFKKEFNITNEFSIQNNIDIFESMSKFVTHENFRNFNAVDFTLKNYNAKLTKHFPLITNLIDETRQIFNKKSMNDLNANNKDFNISFNKDDKDKNNFSFVFSQDNSNIDTVDKGMTKKHP